MECRLLRAVYQSQQCIHPVIISCSPCCQGGCYTTTGWLMRGYPPIYRYVKVTCESGINLSQGTECMYKMSTTITRPPNFEPCNFILIYCDNEYCGQLATRTLCLQDWQIVCKIVISASHITPSNVQHTDDELLVRFSIWHFSKELLFLFNFWIIVVFQWMVNSSLISCQMSEM